MTEDISVGEYDQLAMTAKASFMTYLLERMKAKRLTATETKMFAKELSEVEERVTGAGGRFLTAKAVAVHYGVTHTTIGRHVRNKRFKPNADGSFNKNETDAYFCGKLKRPVKNMAGEVTAGEAGDGSTPGLTEEYERERIRKIRAEADAKEFYAQQLRGNVVPIDEVRAFWAARARLCRDLLTTLIDRVPPLVVGLEQVEIRKLIEHEVKTILEAFVTHGRFTPRLDGSDRDPGLSPTERRRRP